MATFTITYPEFTLSQRTVSLPKPHVPKFIRTRKVCAYTLMRSGSALFNLGIRIYPHKESNIFEDAIKDAFEGR